MSCVLQILLILLALIILKIIAISIFFHGEIKTALKTLYSDKKLLETMGFNASQTAKICSIDKIVKQIEDLYKKVILKKGHSNG